MDIKHVEQQLAKFIYDLETEDRLVRVGLKETAETEKVYKKYQDLFSRQILDFLQIETKKASGKNKEALERIYFTIASCYTGQNLAKDSDKINSYFSKAKVRVNGEEIAYFQVYPRISKETIFDKREKYDDEASKIVAKINLKILWVLEEEIKLLKSLGFGGYLNYFQAAKSADYRKFYKVVGKIKKDTDKVWLGSVTKVSQEVLKRPFKKIMACHMLYLRSLSMFDNYYPVDKVVLTFKKFVQDAGFGDLLSKIEIDDKDRARKNPRAVCYWPNPPKEVHLVIKPIGGEQDFEAIMHEGGHGLHAAAVGAHLPITSRLLARSNALTEAYAFILEDLVFEPAWLTRYLNVSDHTGGRIKWQATFVNLMLLRRYLGKFSYEYEMFAGNKIKLGAKLYKKNLEATTGFVIRDSNWLNDMDSGFYSADYLRAWIGAAQIKDYLVKKYGKNWFFNPKAFKFLRDLWARGVADELEDVVKRLGYKPWDTSLLISGYKQLLG